MPYRQYLSPVENLIEEARNGRMFILVDDEERENEGDLVIPAQMATPDAINFMAKHGRGLICLAMASERLRQLDLPLMVSRNSSRHQTAFTVSIEAREGVTTGISASDRARTIAVAIDPGKGANDIAAPGHVFPLEARDGGVLVRAGHTEAAVDFARLANLNPSGVICEIMNEDGTMARMPDLVKFAQFHGLKIGTIADLIAYRLGNDRIIERTLQIPFESRHGSSFDLHIYVNKIAYAEHIALVKGDLGGDEPVLVRMHALNVLGDALGEIGSGGRSAGALQRAMEIIGERGRGAIVVIREPHATALSDRLNSRLEGNGSGGNELRDYGVGAQILRDLGIKKLTLLSNSERNIVGIEGWGLTVCGREPIDPDSAGD